PSKRLGAAELADPAPASFRASCRRLGARTDRVAERRTDVSDAHARARGEAFARLGGEPRRLHVPQMADDVRVECVAIVPDGRLSRRPGALSDGPRLRSEPLRELAFTEGLE